MTGRKKKEGVHEVDYCLSMCWKHREFARTLLRLYGYSEQRALEANRFYVLRNRSNKSKHLTKMDKDFI